MTLSGVGAAARLTAGPPSEEFGCGEEVATLVAMLQVDQVLQKPRAGTALLKARVAHRTFEVRRPTGWPLETR